jgi:hypothetical protein
MIYLNPHSVRVRRTAHQYRKRLSTRQEEFLVEWILEQETQGFPPSHARTCEMASRIIRMNGDTQELGKRFVLYRLAASLLPPLSLQQNGLWCARDLRDILTACVDLFEQQSQVRHLTGIHSATVSVDLETLSSLLESIDNLFDFSIKGRVLGTHGIEILKVMNQNRHLGRCDRGQELKMARRIGEQASGVVETTLFGRKSFVLA